MREERFTYSQLTLGGRQDRQVDNHHGFVKSYVSSLRHAPSGKQEYDRQRIGQWLTAHNSLPRDI